MCCVIDTVCECERERQCVLFDRYGVNVREREAVCVV